MSDNLSRKPLHLGGPKVMESDRQFSIYVSRVLDCLGKSQDMIKCRVGYFTENERCRNIINGNLASTINAGSKGEGLTALFESDFDIMHVDNRVICADNTEHIQPLPILFIVFEADRGHTSPGYTKLRLDRFRARVIWKIFENSLLEDGDGNFFMSSDCYVEEFKNTFIPTNTQKMLNRCGPSLPSVGGGYRQDYVLAFQCFIQELTQAFITRDRSYGFPTTDQLHEIAFLESHVVPVGYKGSQTAFLEWRICYTKTERFLMRSLNDTLTKTYILLKMVAKTYLKLVCKDITSYVLKNIVLWQAECVNCATFNEELLVSSLIQALFFLRNCIINKSLPSYMIPERNLLSAKLDLGQRQKLVMMLTVLIHKGGALLMGCERLCSTMIVLYKTPDIAEKYRWKRDIIEKLYLLHFNRLDEKYASGATLEQLCQLNDTEASYSNINKTLVDLILPDNISLMLQGHDTGSRMLIYDERRNQWLS